MTRVPLTRAPSRPEPSASRILSRRRALAGLAAGSVTATLVLVAPAASAGTYLTSAAMLVTEARRESEVLRKRLHDKELARLVHKLAEARLKAATTMHVPPEVAQAHPHLVLVLEAYERGAETAIKAQYERYLVFLSRAREEEENFRAILKQLGWELPKVD